MLPATAIDELTFVSSLTYYLGFVPVTSTNTTKEPVNCAANEKCTLLDSNDVFGPGAPAGVSLNKKMFSFQRLCSHVYFDLKKECVD